MAEIKLSIGSGGTPEFCFLRAEKDIAESDIRQAKEAWASAWADLGYAAPALMFMLADDFPTLDAPIISHSDLPLTFLILPPQPNA